MTRRARQYVLDTHLFIQAFRDPVANQALQRFHRAFSPFENLSVIVAQELRAAARQPNDLKAVERNVLRVFERAGRTITPSTDAWHRSGDLLSEMANEDGLEIARVSRAFRERHPACPVVPRVWMCADHRERPRFFPHPSVRVV